VGLPATLASALGGAVEDGSAAEVAMPPGVAPSVADPLGLSAAGHPVNASAATTIATDVPIRLRPTIPATVARHGDVWPPRTGPLAPRGTVRCGPVR
jgi:hypothetical protein